MGVGEGGEARGELVLQGGLEGRGRAGMQRRLGQGDAVTLQQEGGSQLGAGEGGGCG